jgi:diguanylate cyclase (GGDEF)-like protein
MGNLPLFEFLIPLFSSGVILGGTIIAAIVAAKYRNHRYFSFLSLSLISFLFIVMEVLVLYLGSIKGSFRIAAELNRIEQYSLLGYMIVIPYFLRHSLMASSSSSVVVLRMNRILFRAGILLCALGGIVAFGFPDFFVSVTEQHPNAAIYARFLGRGAIGPLFPFRDYLFFIYALYLTVILLIEIIKLRGRGYLVPLFIGIMFTIYSGVDDLIFNLSGRYIDPFPAIQFSRFIIGLTIFQIGATFSLARWFLEHVTLAEKRKADLEKKQKDLTFLAYRDFLTGWLNRKSFYLHLDHLVTGLRLGSGTPVALILINLDHFKAFNNSFGHANGDLLLKQAGERLMECLGEGDSLFRVSGDEYGIISEALSSGGDVTPLIKKLTSVFSESFQIQEVPVYMSSSIGIAFLTEDGIQVSELVSNAETALREAKKERNTFRYFTEEMQAAAERRMIILHGIRAGIEDGQFYLNYQPIINSDGSVVGAEALLRWNHTELGRVSPEEFIPQAEASGYIHVLGDWAIEQAFQDLKLFEESHPGFQMNINLSVKQLQRKEIIPTITSLLDRYQVNPAQVGFEITESALVEDFSETLTLLEALTEMGFELSIDDFGTGYSSLSYLKVLPVHIVKIDKTFIAGIPENEADKALVSSIIILAKNLGFEVLAEGVETEAQAMYLETLGCDFCQGYLFGEPMAIDKMLSMISVG